MIRPVSYSEILKAGDLLHEYAMECSLPELGYASPQRELYELLEKSGGFQAFGVYEGETMIGFAAVLIYVLPHYGQKVATSESIFISASHRNSSIGCELLAFLEEYARNKDCLAFLYSAPAESRFDKLLSLRYRHSNNVYLRSLL